MENKSGKPSREQLVEKGQRITRVAGPAGADGEQRGQRVQGGARTAPAPESVAPLTSMPQVVLETPQTAPAPAAPVSQSPTAPATQAPTAPAGQ
jgi:hypothetical protein